MFLFSPQCGPCRSFTPKLKETYKTVNEAKKFDIIFVSSDRDEDSFAEYYGEMPWLALKFKDDRKKPLSRLFNVSGKVTLLFYCKDFIPGLYRNTDIGYFGQNHRRNDNRQWNQCCWWRPNWKGSSLENSKIIFLSWFLECYFYRSFLGIPNQWKS